MPKKKKEEIVETTENLEITPETTEDGTVLPAPDVDADDDVATEREADNSLDAAEDVEFVADVPAPEQSDIAEITDGETASAPDDAADAVDDAVQDDDNAPLYTFAETQPEDADGDDADADLHDADADEYGETSANDFNSDSEIPSEAQEVETLENPAAAPRPEPVNRTAKHDTPLRKKTIFDLKLNDLDRDLSDEQRAEWNAIYASFRSKNVMSGTVIGVDRNTFEVTNRETGAREKKTMHTLIVIGYRVKIIIPESELWLPGEERPSHIVRAMTGAKIEFVILEIDREGECAIASRRRALTERRRHFSRTEHREGEPLTCRVTAVGAKRCSVECGGYDLHLT